MKEKYIDERFPTWELRVDQMRPSLNKYIEAIELIKALCMELDKTEEGKKIIKKIYYGE